LEFAASLAPNQPHDRSAELRPSSAFCAPGVNRPKMLFVTEMGLYM
jgi:hypothetical protein